MGLPESGGWGCTPWLVRPCVKQLTREHFQRVTAFKHSALYAIARPSVRLSFRLSDTRVDQSKTVEIRIMQPSPQSSPMTGFLTVYFTAKFQREHRQRGRRMTEG